MQPSILNVSHRYRAIFVHIPKNAGTSIKSVLDMPGGGHFSWRHYARLHPELWRDYTTFTVVRNPWDRAVSAYRHARMKNSHWHNEERGLHPDYELLSRVSFAECLRMLCHERERLKHESWSDQVRWVVDAAADPPHVVVDRVLRLETLEQDFADLCPQLGVACDQLPTMNRSKRSREYRQYYDDETRGLVERAYAADVETFGYTY